ncbi:hypothetical protein [Vreelandella sp. EE27]
MQNVESNTQAVENTPNPEWEDNDFWEKTGEAPAPEWEDDNFWEDAKP